MYNQKFANGKYKDLTGSFCVHAYFFNLMKTPWNKFGDVEPFNSETFPS